MRGTARAGGGECSSRFKSGHQLRLVDDARFVRGMSRSAMTFLKMDSGSVALDSIIAGGAC